MTGKSPTSRVKWSLPVWNGAKIQISLSHVLSFSFFHGGNWRTRPSWWCSVRYTDMKSLWENILHFLAFLLRFTADGSSSCWINCRHSDQMPKYTSCLFHYYSFLLELWLDHTNNHSHQVVLIAWSLPYYLEYMITIYRYSLWHYKFEIPVIPFDGYIGWCTWMHRYIGAHTT